MRRRLFQLLLTDEQFRSRKKWPAVFPTFTAVRVMSFRRSARRATIANGSWRPIRFTLVVFTRLTATGRPYPVQRTRGVLRLMAVIDSLVAERRPQSAHHAGELPIDDQRGPDIQLDV